MINLKEKALELEENAFERFKIKFGFKDIPDYACSTIQDFLENKKDIGIQKQIIFPALTYVPLDMNQRQKLGYEILPITLSDVTGKLEVYLMPNMGGGFVAEHLKEMWAGGSVYNVLLINGVFWPFKEKADEKIYLRGIKPQIKKKQKEYSMELSELLSKIFPDYGMELIPIKL